MATKTLRTVTDRFSIVDNIRQFTPHNGRKYLMSAIRSTLESPEVKERISLGEMYGYYGHTNRALYHKQTGSLDLPESCTVVIDGKPVVLNSVPSNRTLEIKMDDDGVIEHTQEIFDTESGHIVDGMERSQAGGWSWATGGSDNPNLSLVTSFHGMDYVSTPNYISLNRQSAMLESVTDMRAMRIEELIKVGYSEQGALDILAHFDKMQSHDLMFESTNRAVRSEAQMLVMQGRMLELQSINKQQAESINAAQQLQQRRQAMLESAVKALPVFLTGEQKTALLNMKDEGDLSIVSAMFESISNNGLATLPLGRQDARQSVPATPHPKIGETDAILPFGASLL